MKRFVLASLFTSSHFLLAYLVMPLMITHCGADAPYIRDTGAETTPTPAACKRLVNLTAECAKIISDDQSAFETQRAKEEEEGDSEDDTNTEDEDGAAGEDAVSGDSGDETTADGNEEEEEDGDLPTGTRIALPDKTDLTGGSRFKVDTNAINRLRASMQDFVLQDQNIED